MGSILAVLLILLILIVIEKNDQNNTNDNIVEQGGEISLDKNIVITSIEPYSGSFMEDGSDEDVENILMITVKNNGMQSLQYAEVILTFGDSTAVFSFSTLRPGESMVVLEKNRLEYPDKELTEHQIQNVVYFEENLNFCEDKFEISAMDGAFNVKNISGEDLSGNIAIYYKNKQDNIYYGGITYRVVIEGGIEKDGIKQVVTEHFKTDKSEVMFVSYTKME